MIKVTSGRVLMISKIVRLCMHHVNVPQASKYYVLLNALTGHKGSLKREFLSFHYGTGLSTGVKSVSERQTSSLHR